MNNIGLLDFDRTAHVEAKVEEPVSLLGTLAQ
jgi:hypothetical protein